MAMINGPVVAQAIADPGNELAMLAKQVQDDRQLVDTVFLRDAPAFPIDHLIAKKRCCQSLLVRRIRQQIALFRAGANRPSRPGEAGPPS